ncbi:Pc18g04730 [Penicillium rubens Wisconsin 54-1255]|uniref:Pc18g04730 protein n=1 Tax=Penicillium rubens (strain ATCC 28089 / DSM 1075 / NRRL 1951 / Wisconsin 54-1255) TaxID=500485 RepID=B6HBR7_PENRW|nr:Pc18g04730 [Penicillium rubens Wisconsin 54-1255]
MAFLHNLCWIEVEPRVAAIVLCILVPSIFCSVVAKQVPFPARKDYFSVLYQQYKFVVDGPSMIKKGYEQFASGLFEIPRTFRFGQVILCQPELIEELRNKPSTLVSPEPWIDQLLQVSHVMPGYFPKGMGWPKIAKTTPGLIRATVYKHLHRYMPSMNQAIISQLQTLDFKDGSNFALVGSRLSRNEEYIKAVKDHILGMIVTTRVQFLVPDRLKPYIGGLIGRLATLGTSWDMHASRKIMLKHFDARAAEYHAEIFSGNQRETSLDESDNPVEIFQWLYESSVLRERWTYAEVIGEMLLLQFAFIYTTSYGLYGALAELARRPEYIAPLREEIDLNFSRMGPTVPACDGMVLMDSFLKECQRLHPPSALSAHRVCISDLKLSNGVTLKQGSHVAVPSGIIQRSSEHYTNPDAFDGFRFVKRAAGGAKDSRLVDLSPDYLVFGMGAHACPGRWMACALMKLAFAHILNQYDILLPNSTSLPLTGSLSFEEFYVPNFGLRIALRRR